MQEGLPVQTKNIAYFYHSKDAFFAAIDYFAGEKATPPPIGINTYLSPRVIIGHNVTIGANCVLDGDITIEDDTEISHNVTIMNRVHVGKRCIIGPGTRIGQESSSWTEDESHGKTMLRHYGGVFIGNDVQIFANCCIDRGVIDDTTIMDGCRINCLSHIAHNCILEENCMVISMSNLYGSVHLYKNVYLASALVRNQCSMGENSKAGMGAVVTKDVPPDTTVVGCPARPIGKKGMNHEQKSFACNSRSPFYPKRRTGMYG